jgi:hypothetical protein
MDPIDDLRIDPGSEHADPELPQEPAPGKSVWAVLTIVGVPLLFAVAFVAFLMLGRPAEDSSIGSVAAPVPMVDEQPRQREPLGPAVEAVELPPLDSSDPFVRQLVRTVSSHPGLAAWLATDGLLRNVAVCVENVAEGKTPARHLTKLAPTSPFSAETRRGKTVVAPRSYARYNGIAELMSSLDAAGVARIYATLRPRLVEAYRELGHPEGDIDGAVDQAIARMLDTPVPAAEVVLAQPSVMFTFADEAQEALSPAQKQLLRMGPRNMQIVQNALRAIARELHVPRANPAPKSGDARGE